LIAFDRALALVRFASSTQLLASPSAPH